MATPGQTGSPASTASEPSSKEAQPGAGSIGFMEAGLHKPGQRLDGGRCVGADGTLAGSDLDMAGAVRNTVDRLGVAPEIAAAMAATYPAAFLRLSQERGTLQVGRTADWVVLTRDLHPVGTWIGGAGPA